MTDKITNEDIYRKLDEILQAIRALPQISQPPSWPTYQPCQHEWEWIAITYYPYGYWQCKKCGISTNLQQHQEGNING